MTDLRQSPNYARYMRSLGWIVEEGMFIKKLWFTSIVKIQHPAKINLSPLKKYHPFLIKMEPNVNFKFQISNFKFSRDNWPLIPSKTIVLDLEKIVLPKDTRYEIRKAEKKNLKIKQSDDIEQFYKILQETMKIGHWEIPIKKEVINLWKSFQPNNSVILLTCHPGTSEASDRIYSERFLWRSRELAHRPLASRMTTVVAGCLLVWHGDTAHYMYAANTRKGRESGAAYLTLWEAIKFCQSKSALKGRDLAPGGKLKYLDLEGIYDDRFPSSTKNWQGFTAFKMQWGGKIVEYPGSYTKYF